MAKSQKIQKLGLPKNYQSFFEYLAQPVREMDNNISNLNERSLKGQDLPQFVAEL